MSSWSLESWENSFVKSYIWLVCYTPLHFNFGIVLQRLYKIWELFCMFVCLLVCCTILLGMGRAVCLLQYVASISQTFSGRYFCLIACTSSSSKTFSGGNIFVCLLHHIIGRGDCTRRPLGAITHPRKGGELHLLPYIRITCKTCGKDSEDRKTCWSTWKERKQWLFCRITKCQPGIIKCSVTSTKCQCYAMMPCGELLFKANWGLFEAIISAAIITVIVNILCHDARMGAGHQG